MSIASVGLVGVVVPYAAFVRGPTALRYGREILGTGLVTPCEVVAARPTEAMCSDD